MTRREIILKAVNAELTWIQAADILGITARHMRRLKTRYEEFGFDGLVDGRGGRPRRKRIPLKTIRELCRLKREVYPDFSMRHFWEFATEKNGLKISYSWTRRVLEEAGIVEKSAGRGKYRRKRERRPMVGMLIHLDASKHEWIPGLPPQDLVVALDDADSRILYMKFVEEEGTASTFEALDQVLRRYGRFCELYTDRGSHFCRTTSAGHGPDEQQNGQVSRALKALGIRQILARSPEARGRSERAFGTLQGRLPQELRLAGVSNYADGNRYLATRYQGAHNRRFTVKPTQPESAFIPLVGIDLELVLSSQSERVVRNDSTVAFAGKTLQLPKTKERAHYVRCQVLVHEFFDGTLGISYMGKLLARYTCDGDLKATGQVRDGRSSAPGYALRSAAAVR